MKPSHLLSFLIAFLLFSCDSKENGKHPADGSGNLTGQIRKLQNEAELRAGNGEAAQLADSALRLSRKSGNLKMIMRSLKLSIQEKLHAGDYDVCIDYSKDLLDKSLRTNSDEYRLYALIGLGQSYMMKRNWALSKQYLYEALELGQQMNDRNALCSVYNGLGLYHTNGTQDFREAIRYFLEGIQCAKLTSNNSMYSLLISNVGVVYYLTRNPEGLQYALESYEMGLRLKQDYLIYMGSSQAAQFMYLEKKFSQATFYSNIAESKMRNNGFMNEAIVYNLKGALLAQRGNYAGSVAYYRKALTESRQTQLSDRVETFLGYGQVLVKQKKYTQACVFLEKGLLLADSIGYFYQTKDLYREMAVCYELSGRLDQAVAFYKRYIAEAEKQNLTDKNKSIHELMIRFESEKKEQLIHLQKLELEKKQRTFYLETTLLVLVILILVFVYTLYSKREKRYLEIVRQNVLFVERERDLLEQLSESANKNENESSKYAQSSLTDAKHKELFGNLQKLMRDKQVFKDNQINKDKLSEMLDTNRTYLSQVINEQTGLSFTNYMNTLRIEEARRILSDPDNDTPLKAIAAELGFNSLSTFYSAFQHIIGVPPSAYRSKLQEIHQTESQPQQEEAETADASQDA